MKVGSHQIIRDWIKAWDRYGHGSSLMHPRISMAIDSARKFLNENEDSSSSPCQSCKNLGEEIAKLKEKLDWQNIPNSREPIRGGYEFYINEEWTGLRDAALGEDVGFQATLMKVRYDPDDERVRVRRVLDDDAILEELAILKLSKLSDQK